MSTSPVAHATVCAGKAEQARYVCVQEVPAQDADLVLREPLCTGVAEPGPAVRMVADRTVGGAAGFKGITAHIDQYGIPRLQVEAGGSHGGIEFIGFDRRVHPGAPPQRGDIQADTTGRYAGSRSDQHVRRAIGTRRDARLPAVPASVQSDVCQAIEMGVDQAVAVDLDTVRTRRMAGERRLRERFHQEGGPRLISADGSARLQRPGQRKALSPVHRRNAAQPRLWRYIAQRSVARLIVLHLSQVLVGKPLNPVRDGVHA